MDPPFTRKQREHCGCLRGWHLPFYEAADRVHSAQHQNYTLGHLGFGTRHLPAVRVGEHSVWRVAIWLGNAESCERHHESAVPSRVMELQAQEKDSFGNILLSSIFDGSQRSQDDCNGEKLLGNS